LVLRKTIAGHALQPRREALVHLAPGSLGRRLVGRIAHEDMAEPERVLTGERRSVGTDQLLALQRLEVLPDGRAGGLRRGRRHPPPEKNLAPARGALDPRALLVLQAIQSGRDQGLDRPRGREPGQVGGGNPRTVVASEYAVVDQRVQHLLDEEWIALGSFDDAI